jgi:macrodomain Ter protein organizer (MatP/YcbG family)
MTTSHFDRTQILLEPAQRRKLARIATREKRSLSDVVREMIDLQLSARKRQEMADGAKALLSDYQTDQELTAFIALDGEDVR